MSLIAKDVDEKGDAQTLRSRVLKWRADRGLRSVLFMCMGITLTCGGASTIGSIIVSVIFVCHSCLLRSYLAVW